MNIPRTEFAAALAQVAAERGIDVSQVLESIKLAILTAYKKDYGTQDDYEYEVEVDPQTGESHLFAWPVEHAEKREEITPAGFGRIAAQQARNIIVQKIREAEKNSILEEYEKRIGTLVNGMILRFEGDNILVDLGKGEALMPPSEQSKGDSYRLNLRMVFYLEGIRETMKGRQIIVSRAHEGLVIGLFRREVPEVASRAVEIAVIAREAGSRTKMAVSSQQVGVDPVGSCVGQKGVRVQAVINELNGEKIDIIQFSEDLQKFISAALAPAENLEIKVDEGRKTALVLAPEDQLSLAIGKGGQNVRLAMKLTGFKIDIQGKGMKPEEKATVEETGEKAEEEKEKASQKPARKPVKAKRKKKEEKPAEPK
ncbi:MAG TPA: transcription termination factor NusA [Patescibacteria group bacterium]|nr:transcription termination factor NusA [Patescibacteria group bacterium]